MQHHDEERNTIHFHVYHARKLQLIQACIHVRLCTHIHTTTHTCSHARAHCYVQQRGLSQRGCRMRRTAQWFRRKRAGPGRSITLVAKSQHHGHCHVIFVYCLYRLRRQSHGASQTITVALNTWSIARLALTVSTSDTWMRTGADLCKNWANVGRTLELGESGPDAALMARA
jgi:hypothetical protein